MNIAEAIKIAFLSLWANKLRSVLTLLGVVIGVAAVIAVVTFVNGINGYVATKIFNLGADVFIVFKNSPAITNVDKYLEAEKRKDLTMEDYEAVLAACKHCEWVGAALRNDSGKVKYGEQSISDSTIRGMTPSMVPILDIDLTAGRMINDVDVRNNSAVVVVGPDIVDNLMPGIDPINKEIRIDGWIYRVIGVGKRKGKTLGQSQDNWVAMPLTTFLNTYGSNRSLTIYGRANGVGDPLEMASDEMRTILRSHRHDRPGVEDSFSLDTNSTFVGLWQSISSSFSAVFVSLAAISLVVGGIVIMNIMLVSVSERTREIGVRKALGARRHDVMLQFLIESATMSLVGGLIGVIAGAGIAKTITLVIGFPSEIQLWSVALGLFVATAVGVFFGVYPARKAAQLDPIVALRSEL